MCRKHPVIVPSPSAACGPSCDLLSGLNQICQAYRHPVATAPLSSESQLTYHLPLPSLTGQYGLFLGLENSK